MRADGLRIQAADAAREQKIKDNEKKVKRRARKYSATVIQAGWRAHMAIQRTRKLAYCRYKKHFDTETLNYFYEDLRFHTKSWSKPAILGSYDVDCEDAWVKMFDSQGDRYFYNIHTWSMSWEFPQRTVPCMKCFEDFAVGKLALDKDIFGDRPQFSKENTLYCNACMYEKCAALEAEGIDAEEITFKSIDGSKSNSNLIKVDKLPSETWYNYVMSSKLRASGLI